jgi:magnesium-transporting ATPase (P-type)
VGAIAEQVSAVSGEPPPLIRRMEHFARRLGAIAIVLCMVLTSIGLAYGQPLSEVLLAAVALAVSAIPEGLPVALTVALAVGVSRMARQRVVVRSLPAVEALGSCSVIATDKTGTLTHNQLTVERIVVGSRVYEVSGRGYVPDGTLSRAGRPAIPAEEPRLFRLLRAAALANEGSLLLSEDGGKGEGVREREAWEWSGDPTDVALLGLGIKAGIDADALREVHASRAMIPFESERRYAASFHARDSRGLVCVKGAPERVLEMCEHTLLEDASTLAKLDCARELAAAEKLMADGFRVLAVADAETPEALAEGATPSEPSGLVFLGLVAMDDPPREGVRAAMQRCHEAGIHVVMVTGDHATTGRAIAARVGLAKRDAPVLTGLEIEALDDAALQERIVGCRVVARANPADKLRVVRAAQESGAFVAVTGDGVNATSARSPTC